MNLAVVTINVNGVRSRKLELIHFSNTLKSIYDNVIIMLNDTRLHGDVNFQIPEFAIVRADKNTNDSSSGGVAIAIPANWDIQPVEAITESGNGFESLGLITSCPKGFPLKLMSLYNHPQHHAPRHLFEAFLDLKLNNKDIHGIIGGDLNCPHEAFSSRFTNVYGTGLLTTVNNLNLCVLDNDEPTHYHRGEPNVLDLFLCHPRSCHLIRECFVGESIGSDHLPLIAHLEIGSRDQSDRQVFIKRSFNAPAFKDEVDHVFKDFNPNCSNIQEVDVKIEELTQRIKEIKEKHLIEKPIHHHRTNLSPEVLSWIKTRKRLLKCLKKCSNTQEKAEFSRLYNRANKIVKNLLEAHDHAEKENMVSKMQSLDDTGKMWRLYHKFKNHVEPNNEIKRPLINDHGDKILDSSEKAELFATRMETVHQTPMDPKFDQNFQEEISTFISQNEHKFSAKQEPSPEPDENHPLLAPISVADIKAKILEAKNNSAPGEDEISYNLLKHCPEIFFLKLIVILNFCLSTGYFPKAWKDAKVTMLQKPNKDHSNPKNYRPISLLPVLGKVFEKLLCERLVWFLDQNKVINQYQAGFRKKRSTQEHIFRLSQQTFNGFKEKKCTIGVFLDVESAFDAVWTNGLMHKLHQLKLPANFLRILCSFLKDRSLRVHVNKSKSRPIPLHAGTPQGSCLSPILFSIYVNDIPFNLMNGCQPSQYADDTCIWSTGSDSRSTGTAIQNSLNKMEQWCCKWRVKLCPSKTKVVLFTRCYKVHQFQPPLFLFGEQLTYSSEATFLGVKFNSSLTWEPQIRSLLAKAQPRLNLLRAISGYNANNDANLLLHLYRAIVRPIFEYSSIAHVSAAECHQLKLQQLQNSAIRCSLGIPRYTNTEILHDASGLAKLHQHNIAFAKKRLSSMKTSSPLIQDTLDQFQQVAHISAHKSPLDFIL